MADENQLEVASGSVAVSAASESISAAAERFAFAADRVDRVKRGNSIFGILQGGPLFYLFNRSCSRQGCSCSRNLREFMATRI